jgi:hypothetical protein
MRRTCKEDERRRGFIWRGVVVVDAIRVAYWQGSGGAGLGLGRGFLITWMLLGWASTYERKRAVRLIIIYDLTYFY